MPKRTNGVRRNGRTSKPQSEKTAGRLVKRLSRSGKNKIWHNWLTEENYLF
jgi:hypothetical protein